jgi:hypothetical protein
VGAVDEGAAAEFVVDAHHAFEGRAGELGAGGRHGGEERGEGRAERGGRRVERGGGREGDGKICFRFFQGGPANVPP